LLIFYDILTFLLSTIWNLCVHIFHSQPSNLVWQLICKLLGSPLKQTSSGVSIIAPFLTHKTLCWHMC
jgi:hypothetical protein